jgi:hypothetical protein
MLNTFTLSGLCKTLAARATTVSQKEFAPDTIMSIWVAIGLIQMFDMCGGRQQITNAVHCTIIFLLFLVFFGNDLTFEKKWPKKQGAFLVARFVLLSFKSTIGVACPQNKRKRFVCQTPFALYRHNVLLGMCLRSWMY